MASPPGSAAGELPAHRACAHCRSQKVRCIPDETNPDICGRCAKAGRPCVFTPLQKRKQRKRTDTRVAELEREMRMMRTMLKQKQDEGRTSPLAGGSAEAPGLQTGGMVTAKGAGDAMPSVEPRAIRPEVPAEMRVDNIIGTAMAEALLQQQQAGGAQQRRADGSPLWPQRLPDRPPEKTPDVVDRGLLSMATARQLFETFKHDLFPHYPTMTIPDNVTADQMRKEKPVLFLALIAAAAGKENSDLSAVLDKEILEAYATRSLMHSEKSLELVQSLLISAVWYHPPSKFGQLKYYEYIHMAATMAMDLGIGTRPKHARNRFSSGNRSHGREAANFAVHSIEDTSNPDLSMAPRSRDHSPDTGSMESRRTFLSCYMICSGVSLSLRRPNMLRVSSYIRECIDLLDQSPDALPTDRMLAHWARLSVIADEISTAFCYDDPGGEASITEIRTQLMLKDFEDKLARWYDALPPEINGSLIIMYHSVRLYLHEIALHVDHSPEDFKAPYQMGGVQPLRAKDNEEPPTHVLATCIADCISSSHALLDAFIGMEPSSLRALPVSAYVRVSFAAFVLAKLSLSAIHPSSRIGKILDRSTLKAESYMDRAVLHVRNVVGARRCRVPAIFLALLFKLRQWCMSPEMIEAAQNAGVSEPYNELRSGGTLPASEPKMVVVQKGNDSGFGTGSTTSPQVQADGPPSVFSGAPNAGVSVNDLPPNSGRTPDSLSSPDGKSLPQILKSYAGTEQSTFAPTVLPSNPDEMQLDGDLMAYFGSDLGLSVGADFPEGGLTGLNDWMPMPEDYAATFNTNISGDGGGMAPFGYQWADSGPT